MMDDLDTSDLPTDLRPAARNLIREFSATCSRGMVVDALASNYDRLASEARVFKFLPLLAERLTREQLRNAADLTDTTVVNDAAGTLTLPAEPVVDRGHRPKAGDRVAS
jgi:hypothetical protein